MQPPQSDDSAWQACVVRHREVTGRAGWVVAGQLRFMHQRLEPGSEPKNTPLRDARPSGITPAE
jgi:hypothetical protein